MYIPLALLQLLPLPLLDADRQSAMNLFLCIYKPYLYTTTAMHIWNINTDFYLHNKSAWLVHPPPPPPPPHPPSSPSSSSSMEEGPIKLTYTQWFDKKLLKVLPKSYDIGFYCFVCIVEMYRQ